MDFIFAFLYVITPIVLSRSSWGLKEKYQNFIEDVDISFYEKFRRVSKLKPILGLDYIGTLLGYASIIVFILMTILQFNFKHDISAYSYVSDAFFITFLGFISIKWYSKPNKFSLHILIVFLKISALFFLFPIVDIFYGIEYTSMPYNQLAKISELAWGISFPTEPNVIVMGLYVGSYVLLTLCFLWALMSVLLALIFIPTLITTFSVIKLCSKIDTYFGKNALNCLLILTIIATQFYSWYK